jgi:hypothetical protein
MSLILQGSTSGSVTLQEPAVAGTTVLDLPATSGNVVVDSATQTLTNKTLTSPTIGGTPTGVGVLTSGTSVASTSGTSIDFTSIPSWVKRVTVMFNEVSTNGTSNYQVQLGTGGVATTSGYRVYASTFGSSSIASSDFTSGYGVRIARAAEVASGQFVFTNLSGNIWTGQYFISDNINGESFLGGGSVTLAGTLNMVRITTVNGTDTFDAGSINILYE